MKKLLFTLLTISLAAPAWAASEMIDPATYICAEFLVTSTDTEPPLFEGLQLDGYASGLENAPVADANSIQPILLKVYDSCAAKPAEKAMTHWQAARKTIHMDDSGVWRADKTTCGDYAANEEDGSGFVIWLDGYQRAKTGQKKSVFADQKTLDHFLAQCKAAPTRLMYDVMVENAK